jgi:hypothetical protein
VLIDCDSCSVRGSACGGCFVAALLGGPPLERIDGESGHGQDRAVREVAFAALAPEEQAAVEVLRTGGLLAEPQPGWLSAPRPAARREASRQPRRAG